MLGGSLAVFALRLMVFGFGGILVGEFCRVVILDEQARDLQNNFRKSAPNIDIVVLTWL